MITPDELRALLKKHRWSIAICKSGKQQVFSAKQRQGKRLATLYIGTSNKLNCLTEEDVVAKINRSAAERLAQQRGSHDQALCTEQKTNEAYLSATLIIPARERNPIAGG